MIQPFQSGARLLDDIDNVRLDARQVGLWWLGQSGFVIKWREAVLFLDPYLSEHLTEKYAATNRPHVRMTEAPFRGADVRRADLVLITHKHSDHFDPGTVPYVLERVPTALLVLPPALMDYAADMGLEHSRLVPAYPDHPLTHVLQDGSRIVVHPIPAAHERLDWSPAHGYPYLGYVLQLGERTLYHSGDCVPYDGLVDWLRPYHLDAALLPINGRNRHHGILGNFTIEEAGQLAAAAGVEWLVPMHYDMFTFNTVDVAAFACHMAEHHPHQKIRILRCGERLILPAL
jgi:L-ascorbate metabolism protein UlaG (beta-lactamase superfamily)